MLPKGARPMQPNDQRQPLSRAGGNPGRNPPARQARGLTWLLFVLCLLSLALAGDAARADLIILKDGFVLYGKVRHDRVYFADPISKQVFWTNKLDGFYMVDDDCRRVIFSAGQVADATKKDFTQAADLMRLDKVRAFRGGLPLPTYWTIDEVTDFRPRWYRDIKLNVKTRSHPLKIKQRVTELTPHHMRVDAYEYNWVACYLTTELGPQIVRSLVKDYLDRPNQKVKLTDEEKGMLVFRFLLQAGWQDEAEKDLLELESKYPKEKTRIADAMQILKKLQALKLVEGVERAHKAGQPRETRRLIMRLKQLKLDQIGEVRLSVVQAIEHQLDKGDEDLKLAKRYLKELPDRVADNGLRPVLAEAARVIADSLTLDTLNRLEGFIGLARQEERYQKSGKRAGQNPAELLAMAVTGWLLGNDAAEAAPATAVKLWQARQFVLKYQTTPESRSRELARNEFSSKKTADLDEVAQMIRFLPPPEPEEKTDQLTKVIREIKIGGGKGPTYFLKLPPEYHHHRSYPVLLVLHAESEDARSHMARWTELAARHGYILAAPVWNKGLATPYEYTPEEHGIVIDVIRDLRRRVQVDSDRVFLFGFEQGGNMAFDVGLSHPDLFAGVATMGGQPVWHAFHYWSNAQNLPFYVIDGTADGLNAAKNRTMFQHWVHHGYPCLYVEYQGRGPEWLSGEMAHVFEWMEPKKRAHPRSLGGKQDYVSMRTGDNRFYWLSTDNIRDGCLNEPGGHWKKPTPAVLEGNIGNSNYIYVSTRGLRDVTVWLAPAAIDFEKPVTIRVNTQVVWNNKKVPPSLETMMEDFYERGDRQQLFLAKKTISKLR
jgi:dienelactone hydrolase